MIAYLSGTIQKKLPKNLIVNTGKIGYLVYIPTPLLEKASEEQEIELYIHTKVREDDISLYGFETLSELEFFKILLGVNGIGPKLGLEIISHNPAKAKAAIIMSDFEFLSKIPGIGKKTAERLVVELKNKLTLDDITQLHAGLSTEIDPDAIHAIENLGYQKFEIMRILKKMPEKLSSAEEIITYFLQNV